MNDRALEAFAREKSIAVSLCSRCSGVYHAEPCRPEDARVSHGLCPADQMQARREIAELSARLNVRRVA
jgi:hypothetical protein